MNQILFSKFNQEIQREENRRKRKLLIIFKYQFAISITIIFACSIYYIFNIYSSKQKEKVSKQLISNFNINLLYSDTSGYTTTPISLKETNDSSFIIGLIEIKKINIAYPILSNVSDDLLKIATCRFYGPMPNEIRKFMYCSTQLS